MTKQIRPRRPFVGVPKFTQAFFTQTSKQLRSCYYALRKHGVRFITIQDNYMEIYLNSKEAFYEIVQELPNVWTERFTSGDVVYHKCKPTNSILIIFEEEKEAEEVRVA